MKSLVEVPKVINEGEKAHSHTFIKKIKYDKYFGEGGYELFCYYSRQLITKSLAQCYKVFSQVMRKHPNRSYYYGAITIPCARYK